jgi:hypothetical protein
MRRWIDLTLAAVAAASLAAAATWIAAGSLKGTAARAERGGAPSVTATAGPRIETAKATAPARPLTRARSSVARRAAPVAAAARPAGLMVAIDPETGALVAPTPEQRARLVGDVAIAGNPAAGLREERAADGTVTLHLDERFAQYSVVRAGTSGAAIHQCVDGRAAADDAVRARALPARAAEEE